MATVPDDDAVRILAYQLWQQRHPSDGSAEGDWYRAQETLVNASLQKVADQAVKESFPASDPPASHLPDEPPVNAEAKWAAAKAAERDEAPRAPPGHATPAQAAAPATQASGTTPASGATPARGAAPARGAPSGSNKKRR